jgi:ubiquitin carboxyl-terminal hydrolase 5/13
VLQVPATPTGNVVEGKKEYQPIKLADSLDLYFQTEKREFECPADNAKTQASVYLTAYIRSQKFQTFPEYLFCAMSRFILGDNWVIEKLNVDIDVPEFLDLNYLRGSGKAEGETELPAESNQGPSFNAEDLNSLIGMGFSELRSKRALIKTNHSGADSAMAWLCEHLEDSDIDAPLESDAQKSEVKFNSDDLHNLLAMGFPEIRCKRALIKTHHNGADAAMTWLFEHMEDADIGIYA